MNNSILLLCPFNSNANAIWVFPNSEKLKKKNRHIAELYQRGVKNVFVLLCMISKCMLFEIIIKEKCACKMTNCKAFHNLRHSEDACILYLQCYMLGKSRNNFSTNNPGRDTIKHSTSNKPIQDIIDIFRLIHILLNWFETIITLTNLNPLQNRVFFSLTKNKTIKKHYKTLSVFNILFYFSL